MEVVLAKLNRASKSPDSFDTRLGEGASSNFQPWERTLSEVTFAGRQLALKQKKKSHEKTPSFCNNITPQV